MSIHLEWLRTGRAPRGTPRHERPWRRLLAIGLIAAMTMIDTGCQSGPSGGSLGCGGCASGGCKTCGWWQRTRAHFSRTPRTYDSGVVGDSSVEMSGASTIVSPSVPAGPLTAPMGTTSVPSSVDSPAGGSAPIQLEQAPTARPGAPPASGSAPSSRASRTSYYGRPSATKTAVRLDSGRSSGQATLSRSSRRTASEHADDALQGEEDNPLDHLPPLGLPGEVIQSATSTGTPSAFRPEGKSAAADKEHQDGISLSAEAIAEPVPVPGARIGIVRFASVDPKLAGGSLPSTAGLAWLAEKGYRTILDLRPSREVAPAFIAEAAAKGLRYLALPVDIDHLDADRLARFQFELAAPEARPLFFFDTDGSRAGALWYIRRVDIDHIDPQMARREAEEIGLKTPVAWGAATAYLDRLEADRARPAHANHPAADAPPTPTPAAALAPDRPQSPAKAEAIEAQDAHTAAETVVALVSPFDRLESMIPPLPPKGFSYSNPPPIGAALPPIPLQQRSSWRPLAAMLLTGLSLPLVYWSRSALPAAIARARASLPAPSPRSRLLPPGSGA